MCRLSSSPIEGQPQTWIVVPADSVDGCTTEILTVRVEAADVLKMGFVGELQVDGNDADNAEVVDTDALERERNEVEIVDVFADEDERRIGESNGSHMHAGFGGRWRRNV